jgi:hypothetical protein
MILLIPVLTLFTGSVTLASNCAKMATGAECSAMGKAPEKCMTAVSHPECKMQGDGSGQKCTKCNKGQTGKDDQKGREGAGCCADCPMCCLVTFKPFFRFDVTRQVTIIDYTVMPNNNLSDYFQQQWKPPNGS